MPKRVICVWKPSSSSSPAVFPLWSSGFLRDNWIDTDPPATKFESNMEYLAAQVPVDSRGYGDRRLQVFSCDFIDEDFVEDLESCSCSSHGFPIEFIAFSFK
ncbi:hypothetical protein SUGI_0276950 [Cryptomeria japonica]|nr:hypothetical protein SUGI_0276950 [Cryptomeria japonica]